MTSSPAIIYGAGGHARELLFQLTLDGITVAALVDDFNHGFVLENMPVLPFHEARSKVPNGNWYVAIGSIPHRKVIHEKLRDLGLTVGSFLSSRALISPTASIGSAAQVFANTVISSGVTISDNVIVNFGSVVSHDVAIGANSFIAPNVTIGGHVDIGDDVWLGAGAIVRNGAPGNRLRIGNDVTVGAAACVVSDVADHSTVIGVPAKRKD